MDDFKIVIDGKECSCTKYDKVYVELDSSVERNDIDYAELNHLVESFNIQRESISCTMHIKKNTKNYERIQELFETLKSLLHKCGEQLKDIADNGDRI